MHIRLNGQQDSFPGAGWGEQLMRDIAQGKDCPAPDLHWRL
jgi:hypothetical protein